MKKSHGEVLNETPQKVDPKPVCSWDTTFHKEIRQRVLEYFKQTGLSPRDNPSMYVKTGLLLLWFVASYTLLVFASETWWHGALYAFSLALSMAGVGFGVQHDANHGAYSEHNAVNRIMGMTLDMLGASSYMWRFKHNYSHHNYTNMAGADDDIDVGVLARLSPAQPHFAFHRGQQFYLWFLYAFLHLKWHLVYDFVNVTRARIAQNHFDRPRGGDLVQLIVGKSVFFAWAIVVPSLFHPLWIVLIFYLGTALVLGFILSVVFQLAHCVEEADFPKSTLGQTHTPEAWALHQVSTTVDFAPKNRLLTWFVGGLNFQIEHHLFPRICHLHYPKIAEIVQATCFERGIRYSVHESFFGALASHWRWLNRMGRR